MLMTLVLLFFTWGSSVLAVPVKKIFLMSGAAEAGTHSGAVKPLLSIGLGPISLQLGLQQWAHLPQGQTPQVGPTSNNVTWPSFNILVPNAVVNVSSLVLAGGQQNGGQQTTDGYWIVETVDAMGNMQTVIVSQDMLGIQNSQTDGSSSQASGSSSQTSGSSSQASGSSSQTSGSGTYEIVEIISENQSNSAPSGMTGIRRGVITKLSEVILPARTTTKPVMQFIKGR